ncbi:MAG: hypothetical protein GY793_09070 [Proteobacteria bacterium]|nr:hypothetical protein [Pseudomonadota bacterium]
MNDYIDVNKLVAKFKEKIIEDKDRYFRDAEYHCVITLRANEYREGVFDTINELKRLQGGKE